MMIRFLIALLLIFGAAGFARSQKTDYPPAKLLTSFRFEQLTGGIVILHATLNQFPDTLNFILDTGSGGISLDTLTAAYYKLPLEASDRTVKGIGGEKKLSFYKAGTLHFKGLDVTSLDFHINDYQILTEVYGLRVDGIIGYSFLRRYIVALDFEGYQQHNEKSVVQTGIVAVKWMKAPDGRMVESREYYHLCAFKVDHCRHDETLNTHRLQRLCVS